MASKKPAAKKVATKKVASGKKATGDDLRDAIEAAAMNGYPFYVYTLADDAGVFYVGKGKGRRLFHHEQLSTHDTNHVKKARIQASGEIQKEVLAFFRDESAALTFERQLIEQWRESLTNMVGGNVGRAEARLAWFAELRAGILPFHEWSAGACDWRRQMAVRVFGSMEAAYTFLMDTIDWLEVNPCPVSVFVPQPNATQEVTHGAQ